MGRVIRAGVVATTAGAAIVTLAGCGSSSKPVTILPARTYHLAGFGPTGTLVANRPEALTFTVVQPSGAPLVHYRTGPGPHTGVHVIVVRSDLGAIIHDHPPVGSDGKIVDRVTFPTPGRYRVVIDVYPASHGPYGNFQLFRWLRVAGPYTPQPVPPFKPEATVDGYRFVLRTRPSLHAIQAAFLTFTVTSPNGTPARFTPWYGALAHAIFFRVGTLDYFHTHVCSPGAAGCTSILGASRVTGSSSRPGRLRVGVLVPVPGTWRLFLQCKVNGRVLTAPFTLAVQ
jgi:hypothetical protein